ncbi:MAG: hypothetical protein ABH956_01085 [Candidatus Nealsonbacteria bacterium]
MNFNKLNSKLKWGIIGGVLGALIGLIGFWIFSILSSPPSESIV